MEEKRIRTRFAPSPTGPIHCGNIRTALYNYLFAAKYGGELILRIEDTDSSRLVEGAQEYIKKSMDWCGIEFDEGPGIGGLDGPYIQSERLELYEVYVQELIKSGHAYYAFDTPAALNAMREDLKTDINPMPKYDHNTRDLMSNSLTMGESDVKKAISSGASYVIRFKVTKDKEITFTDMVRDKVTFNSNEVDDKVLMKSDGVPTYHLAAVIDDHLMKISHVIRGEEWLPSTPLHIMLYEALGWDIPEFAHLPLVLNPDGKGKLSKRTAHRLGFPIYPFQCQVYDDKKKQQITCLGYKEGGYDKDAVVNFMAMLGWNPGNDQEIFTFEELVNAFSMDRVNKAGIRYDNEKITWMNGKYIRQTDSSVLAETLLKDWKYEVESWGEVYKPHFTLSRLNEVYATKACDLLKDRVEFITDLMPKSQYLFLPLNKEDYDWSILKKQLTDNVVEVLTDFYEDYTTVPTAQTKNYLKITCDDLGVKFGDVLKPLRYIITQETGGPELFPIMELIGSDETIFRIKNVLLWLKEQ